MIVAVLATPEGDDTGHKAPMQTCGAKSDRVQGQEQTEDPIRWQARSDAAAEPAVRGKRSLTRAYPEKEQPNR